MLDSLEQAVLIAVEHLTRGTYGVGIDEPDLDAELARMGQRPADGIPYRLITGLKKDGYIEAMLLGGMRWGDVGLTRHGKEVVSTLDPFERVGTEARRLIASDHFEATYPGAFILWAEAERLLWVDDSTAHLTTIGHKIRESTQLFATALVDAHRPQGVDTRVAQVERRLGAVIDLHRHKVGDAKWPVLESLGNLWEATNKLIQRQEHGAQKEGESVTWEDARRIVFVTLFLMVEFVSVLEEMPPPNVAILEP
jgi:hypothetical protein